MIIMRVYYNCIRHNGIKADIIIINFDINLTVFCVNNIITLARF